MRSFGQSYFPQTWYHDVFGTHIDILSGLENSYTLFQRSNLQGNSYEMYFFLGYVHKDVLICRAWCNAWIMDVSILQSCKVGKVRLRCALRSIIIVQVLYCVYVSSIRTYHIWCPNTIKCTILLVNHNDHICIGQIRSPFMECPPNEGSNSSEDLVPKNYGRHAYFC